MSEVVTKVNEQSYGLLQNLALSAALLLSELSQRPQEITAQLCTLFLQSNRPYTHFRTPT